MHKAKTQSTVPIYKKYAKSSALAWLDPSSKLKPSDLAKPSLDVVADDYPMIVEFNNMQDNTSQIHSSVDIDQPLFQPSPKVVVFDDYATFAIHEKKLFFRNNDSVARRIKIIQPDTPFFEVTAPRNANGEPIKQSKIAAGMEICFVVRFKPQEVRDYSLDLVCSTEREKFIVPIRAVGMRPRLTFPDEVIFGNCPIKTPTRKSLLVQNIGTSVAKFCMRSSNSLFSCPSEELTIEPGSSHMVELYFHPTRSSMSAGEYEVEFNKGVKCYIAVSGAGSNADVSLSTPSVALEASYISLSTQKTLKIKNMSDLPIKFTWKSFSNEEEEESERDRLLNEINRMESIEQETLQQRIDDGVYGETGNFNRQLASGTIGDASMDGGVGGGDEDDVIPFSARADEAALIRKYRNLRRALENDRMQFVDDIFELSPVDGHVWANSEMEITASFRPDTAALYNCLAFLDISGRQDRLALHLSGQGIGPHAALSFDVLDVGDVFINDEQQYEISIINKGDIPAHWSFLSSLTRFGTKFEFQPKEGHLLPGKCQVIQILFESEVLGEFSEYFRFNLQGNEDMLVCQIKGHVIGPTFHFDCNAIDFGVVSFDYLHSMTLRLVNTSKISMVFNLHVPQDGTFLKKEFNIEPNEGTLDPGEHMEFVLEFIPTSVKIYDYSLAVDVLGVGDMLLSLPITAECVVSSVRLETKEIDYGDVFIRYPYEQKLKLINASDVVHTKFEILSQPQYTKSTATYETEPTVAVIEPGDCMMVTIRLVSAKLGKFKIPIQINIAGSQEPPLQATLNFNTVGPKIVVGTPELRWGNIECLLDSMRTLKLTNDSLISASLKIFLKMARSKYDVNVRELVLAAHESYDLQITANLDDSVICKDEIHIVVDEGDNVMVPMSAKGIGTTMHCKDDLSILDIGIQLTNTVFEKRVILENKGTRPQQLKWTNKTADEENQIRSAKAKKLGKDPAQKLPKHLAPVETVFTVAPEEITLRPRTATTFTFKGSSLAIGALTETFILESRVGKERTMKQIVETRVMVEVVNPMLEFSVPELSFCYSWERDVEAVVQKKPITLRNVSLVALTFVLKTDMPFNLNSWEHTLEPNESVELIVEFDPLYRDDKTSHLVEKQLAIAYRGHSQKDSVPLKGDIIYPNLQFETQTVNFGSVLNETSKLIKVKTTNWSKVVAAYEWIFMESRVTKARLGNTLPASQVFDILPIRSVLQPGESEDVEFTMVGAENKKFNGIVLCVVEGGPEYKIAISGESSTVSFALDKSIIDFGKVVFTDKQDAELTITNNGKVAFNYDITHARASAAEVIEIIPAAGKITMGQNAKILLRIKPGLPDYVVEQICIRIAHFDVVNISCYCQGIFPGVVVYLPRQKKIGPYGETEGSLAAMWESFAATVSNNLICPDESMLPPPAALQPALATGSTLVAPVYRDPDMDGSAAGLAAALAGADSEIGSSVAGNSLSGSIMSTTQKGPQMLLTEMEMHRLVFCHHLSQKIKLMHANQSNAVTTATTAVATEVLATTATSTAAAVITGSSKAGLQAMIARHINIESIVAANYLCDFGNVICGQTRKKIFKIVNASLIGQLTWIFDKTTLSGSGFSIEPEKVVKLAEQGSVDFVVKYFARTQQKLGRKTNVIPLEIKGSPRMNLILSANVCMPELAISSEVVEFEKVLVGRCRVIYITFQNVSPVTAAWTLKKIPGKEENKITVEPTEGSLRAGKKSTIRIEFIPTEQRNYKLEVLLKVEMNTKPKTLIVRGEGMTTPIRFDQPHIDLGPVIPFSDGDEKVVTVTNLSDVPVEFYSLDFDDGYKEEDAILNSLEIYDNAGLFRASTRSASEPLPKEVMDLYAAALNNKSAEDAGEGASEGGGGSAPVQELKMPPLRTANAPRDEGLEQDILIIGQPISGMSTLAGKLSKKLQLTVTTIDSILNDMATVIDPMGVVARRFLSKLTAAEEEESVAAEAALSAAAETSKVAAVDAFKKQNKKAKEIPPEVYQTPEVIALEAFKKSIALSAENLALVFQFRLTWNDTGYGVIIDGVASNLIDEKLIMEALKISIPKLVVGNVLLPGGAEGAATRISSLVSVMQAKIDEMERSIDNNKKSYAKYKRPEPMSLPPTKKGSTATTPPTAPILTRRQSQNSVDTPIQSGTTDPDICIAVPVGDEPWINQDTGNIVEMDPQDMKSLEENQKSLYLQQLLYSQFCKLQVAMETLKQIDVIWTAEGGLRTERTQVFSTDDQVQAVDEPNDPDEAVEASVPQKTFLYSEYENMILPEILSIFDVLPEAEAASETEEEVEVVQPKAKDCGVFSIQLEGDESEDAMFSTAMALLPPPKTAPPDKDALPPPATYQIIRKPLMRTDRKQIKNFEIIRVDDEADSNEESQVQEVGTRKNFRWVVPPSGSVQLKVKFKTSNEGKFESTMAFEVVGTQQNYFLHSAGVCEVPKINGDSRNVFMRRIRALPPSGPPPMRRFVISENYYSFGPLLTFKKPDWRLLAAEEPNNQLVQTNVDTMRISNNGKYKCTVNLCFENLVDEDRGVFLIEPSTVELEEGESKDVKLWAFPTAVKEYTNKLVLCVSNNPVPMQFFMKCWGCEPVLQALGPWDEGLAAAEAAVASCTDKKLIKDVEAKLAALKEALTIDFGRILIGKTDTRSFELSNTCLCPLAYEIDLMDFKGSTNMTISPASGVIPAGTNLNIVLAFTSADPLMLTGKFQLRYSDAEGGLSTSTRVQTKLFRAVAEAYKIQAVSLTADGQEAGGTEIDFGTLRVGDYASQSLKMGNKGKYKIGYKFVISKPALAHLVKIEPEEGTIETGSSLAEIKLTFCASSGAVQLKQNKDIQVFVSEPSTGEIVEKFSLLLSANAKYNRFRMQPAKGMQFGAVRFDSEAKTKRIELRNEGNFDFTYVICASESEHDELDTLDSAALAVYAYSTPAALRKAELGDNFMSRISAPAAKGAPAKGATPAKGKGAAAPPPSTGQRNPLVRDPDELVLTPIPSDPLTIGAFTVFPRVGVVEPGQCVGIDMKFDPAGCDIAREKVRFCITGVDSKENLVQTIRSFDITGESCFPAIVNDEVHSIFEEQEVVSSLSDSTGADSSEGSGKFEKLSVGKVVYAEAEKMLAYGPVMCNASTGAKGVVERIRITNPTKIDTKVKFQIVTPEMAVELANAAKAAAAAGSGAAKGKVDPKAKPDPKAGAKGAKLEEKAVIPLAFTVQPDCWEIPPHEHRFVNVYFTPTEIKSYRAVFMAEVDYDGTETSATAVTKAPQAGKSLVFNLGGSGTLPCIAVEHPSERLPDGKIPIDFAKVHINRVSKRKVVIRNDGAMPATCLFELTGHSDFVFPAKGSSLTIQPGKSEEITINFAPKVVEENGERSANIKISVLHNQFDQYILKMKGVSYSCDAMIETCMDEPVEDDDDDDEAIKKKAEEANEKSQEIVTFSEINLAEGPGSAKHTILLRSRSNYPLKFAVAAGPDVPKVLSFSPATGHIGPNGTKEVVITFATDQPLKMVQAPISCSLRRIEYKLNPKYANDANPNENPEEVLWGAWDDSMVSVRVASEADIAAVAAADAAMKEYVAKSEAEKAKGKKGKPVGPPPEPCLLQLGAVNEDGTRMINEIVPEPFHVMIEENSPEQKIHITCNGVADRAKFNCDGSGENIHFCPTFLFQTTIHKFSFKNESNIAMPLKWSFDDIKRRGASRAVTNQSVRMQSRMSAAAGGAGALTIPCPFSIEPEECVVLPNSSQQFTMKFLPLDTDEFVYAMKGETLPVLMGDGGKLSPQNSGSMTSTVTIVEESGSGLAGPIRMVIRGSAKRPICHFDIKESPEYMNRRPLNMKNENGLFSPIEITDMRVIEMESIGLRTRNTFRFHITNTTNDSYEFIWDAIGDPSPFWRCIQGAGMLFAGKRIEMVFEYLPEEIAHAESFFKFKLPSIGLEQFFLFAGKVKEPKVFFSTSKIDFHSVVLNGEGGSETIYLENQEHLPFNFSFDRSTLLQLEGSHGPILDIFPKSGTVAPNGKLPIVFVFHPQEEIVYNYNIVCDVKRKPNKLSINMKGEGYAVHPIIQLEQSDGQSGSKGGQNGRFHTLRPAPAVNYADFGVVQVLDSSSKVLTVANNGKYNFDYLWDIEGLEGSMLSLGGGKTGGTLLKGEEMSYKITYAPMREASLDGAMLSFIVAGKYTYNIIARGNAVEPALRFSFMRHDFGPCFVTSPGGSTVIEEILLRLVNHDPTGNISVECTFQKTRALWVDFPPTVLEPGGTVDVPIKFAPRDVKDYEFIVPFVVNGTSKVPVGIVGRGINARLELVNASQRRINFGVANVNTESRKTIELINRAKKAISVQLVEDAQYGGGILQDRCVSYYPKSEFVIQPRETASIQVVFSPSRRIGLFNEDLLVRYAGVTRNLLIISGKSQGVEVALDTDSLPFGVVVTDSQKIKKISLENTGDLSISFQWMENTFGKHFSISPLSGKLMPGSETSFDVVFRPRSTDDDIRQDGILLSIPGMPPLSLTCTGSCIAQPTDSIQTLQFNSLARKAENKTIKIQNPTDKDWHLSPTLLGDNWRVPHDFKVPAKGAADVSLTYFPLTMCNKPTSADQPDAPHEGQLFIALPDGSAQLYQLKGYAGPPECSGQVTVETPAKKAAIVNVKLANWLGDPQKFRVNVELLEPSPATSIIAANAVEVSSNGTKEFPVRFVSYVEGSTRSRITFTNIVTNEYCFYELTARTTMAEVLETITIESPVRQTARYVITVENPIPVNIPVTMGSAAKPAEWWTCDSKYVRVNELSPFSGNHEASFEIEYRPLLTTKQPLEHLLTIISKELGTFKYKLIVTATEPSLRQSLRFDVPLGSLQTENYVFKSFNTAKCDYACAVKMPDFFTLPKTISADANASGWDGQDVQLSIGFEPTQIGEVRDMLTVTSAEGGEYTCELIAVCIPPLPQGPFNLMQNGGNVDIPFRNCFPTTCTWSFSIDSTAFRVITPSASVPAKSQGQCSVVFEPQAEHLSAAPGGTITAKLFVACTSKPGIAPWVFYLRGTIDTANPTPVAAKGGKK